MPDYTQFEQSWNKHWGKSPAGVAPYIPQHADHWLRLYTLPNGERLPESQQDGQIILSRCNALLSFLTNNKKPLMVISAEWTNMPDQKNSAWPKRSEIEPAANYWKSVDEDPTEEDPEFKSYRQIYVREHAWSNGSLDRLLISVAKDEIAGVVIAPPNCEWLISPYDGGVNLFVANKDTLTLLKEQFDSWVAYEDMAQN